MSTNSVKMIAFNLSATDVAIKRIYAGQGLSSHNYDGEAEVHALRKSVDPDYVIVPESLL